MGVHGTDTITSKQGFVPWVPGLPLFPIPIQQWVRSAPSMSWLSHALWWGHGFNGILAAAQDGCFAGFWGPNGDSRPAEDRVQLHGEDTPLLTARYPCFPVNSHSVPEVRRPQQATESF